MVPFSNLFPCLFSLFFSLGMVSTGLRLNPADREHGLALLGRAPRVGWLVGLAGAPVGLGQHPLHPRAAPRFGAGWAAPLGILLASSNNKYC